MSKKTDLLIHTQVLSEPDYKLASANMRPLSNVVVVEMMPIPKRVGRILLGGTSDRTRRDDVGCVIAAHPHSGYYPGQYVVCKYNTGKRMKHFWAGAYRSQNEVRIFGRTQMDSSDEYRIRRFELSSFLPATINYNMFDIDLISGNSILPIHKRIDDNAYESYVRTHPGPDEQLYKVTDFTGRNANTVKLKGGRAYRITVSSMGMDIFNVLVDDIGDWTKKTAKATDRDCPVNPVQGELLIELDELHDQSVGGIYLPEGKTSRDAKATIIKVGSKCPDVNVGDRVLMLSTALGQKLDMMGICNKNLRLVPYEAVVIILDSETGLTKRELEELDLVAS